MQLDDKTILVTGAGAGIGEATALGCAEYGATVVATDIDGEQAQATADAIEDDGGTAEAIEVDVREYDAVESAIETTAEQYGLDGLFNNAGVGHPPGYLEDIQASVRDYVIDVNLTGVWNGCQAALPIMKEQGTGSIVNMSSLAGQIGLPKQAVYSLTKGAVISLTQTVAKEAGPKGVRINAICPGFIDTQLTQAHFQGSDDPEAAREEMEEQYPLKRLGEPEEIADCVAFLLSDASSYVTGHALTADGGFGGGS
jgi:NAD(P)-dependent dehydrogenase (short-subunit alcohol dehydrogenase family)